MKLMDREYWEDENKFGEYLICLLVDYFQIPLTRSRFHKVKAFGEWKCFIIHAKTCSKYEHKINVGINHKFSWITIFKFGKINFTNFKYYIRTLHES